MSLVLSINLLDRRRRVNKYVLWDLSFDILKIELGFVEGAKREWGIANQTKNASNVSTLRKETCSKQGKLMNGRGV